MQNTARSFGCEWKLALTPYFVVSGKLYKALWTVLLPPTLVVKAYTSRAGPWQDFIVHELGVTHVLLHALRS